MNSSLDKNGLKCFINKLNKIGELTIQLEMGSTIYIYCTEGNWSLQTYTHDSETNKVYVDMAIPMTIETIKKFLENINNHYSFFIKESYNNNTISSKLELFVNNK